MSDKKTRVTVMDGYQPGLEGYKPHGVKEGGKGKAGYQPHTNQDKSVKPPKKP